MQAVDGEFSVAKQTRPNVALVVKVGHYQVREARRIYLALPSQLWKVWVYRRVYLLVAAFSAVEYLVQWVDGERS